MHLLDLTMDFSALVGQNRSSVSSTNLRVSFVPFMSTSFPAHSANPSAFSAVKESAGPATLRNLPFAILFGIRLVWLEFNNQHSTIVNPSPLPADQTGNCNNPPPARSPRRAPSRIRALPSTLYAAESDGLPCSLPASAPSSCATASGSPGDRSLRSETKSRDTPPHPSHDGTANRRTAP